MATTKFYLDTRADKLNGTFPLTISISHNGTSALLPVGINLKQEEWDPRAEKIVKHPQRQTLNTLILKRKFEIDIELLSMVSDKRMKSYKATDLKQLILNPRDAGKEDVFFMEQFRRSIDMRLKASTREVYEHTYKRIKAFDPNYEDIRFEDINKEWLLKFEAFLAQTSPSKNARNIHLRNIRAVFNDAIDNDYTSHYPFRRFKIRPVPTAKRSLPVEDLRILFNYPVSDSQVKYLDMFKLTFFLIGINTVDLAGLRHTDLRHDRIEYTRAKTSRLYSVKVEPEARAIIDRYRGVKYLVDISDHYKDYQNYQKKLNKALKRIGEIDVYGRGGKYHYKALHPDISIYWARHTWATIAASLDIPRDTIAHALGHGNNTVTDIYIDFDRSKVDEANRRVIDWVLYNKK